MKMLGLLVLASLLLGCGKDFDPRTLIQDYRVIGVIAEPPEVRGDGKFTLTVADTDHDGDNDAPIIYDWRICAFSLGPLADFECFDRAIEFHLEVQTRTASVDLGPDGVDLFNRLIEWVSTLDQTLPFGDEADAQSGIPTDSLQLQVKVVSGPMGGKKVTTIKRVNVVLDDSELDTNPVIEGLVIGDGSPEFRAQPGQNVNLALEVDSNSFQRYTDARDKLLDEIPLVTWYTTAGKLDPSITMGDMLETTVTLPDEINDSTVRIYAALRDQRGGFAFAEGQIAIVSDD